MTKSKLLAASAIATAGIGGLFDNSTANDIYRKEKTKLNRRRKNKKARASRKTNRK